MLLRQWMAAAHGVLLTSFFLTIFAQSGPVPRKGEASRAFIPERVEADACGLVTNRLSERELARWKSIEAIALAEDANHQPLHPTLRGMWEWLETSGHTIYVEVIRANRIPGCTAGTFSIERSDPRGEHHIGVIRLNLSNIDMAYVGANAARSNGFVPFEKLSREERYVEVLGHELSHAVYILADIERTKLVEETVERTNEMLLNSVPYRRSNFLTPELKGRLSRRDDLLRVLERQAEFMETVIWKELNASRPARDKEKNQQD